MIGEHPPSRAALAPRQEESCAVLELSRESLEAQLIDVDEQRRRRRPKRPWRRPRGQGGGPGGPGGPGGNACEALTASPAFSSDPSPIGAALSQAAIIIATPQTSNGEGARNAHDVRDFMFYSSRLITLHSQAQVEGKPASEAFVPPSGAAEPRSCEPLPPTASAPSDSDSLPLSPGTTEERRNRDCHRSALISSRRSALRDRLIHSCRRKTLNGQARGAPPSLTTSAVRLTGMRSIVYRERMRVGDTVPSSRSVAVFAVTAIWAMGCAADECPAGTAQCAGNVAENCFSVTDSELTSHTELQREDCGARFCATPPGRLGAGVLCALERDGRCLPRGAAREAAGLTMPEQRPRRMELWLPRARDLVRRRGDVRRRLPPGLPERGCRLQRGLVLQPSRRR